jgi:hypothetical protein
MARLAFFRIVADNRFSPKTGRFYLPALCGTLTFGAN